jgi:hypothetical protein
MVINLHRPTDRHHAHISPVSPSSPDRPKFVLLVPVFL